MGRIWSQVAPVVKQRLAWAAAASVAVPWVVGEFAKTFHQPGLDDDALRNAQFIDILVIGVAIFLLSMVVTVGFGCVITAVMKGPRYFGDAFPSAGANDAVPNDRHR
jgi:hypothetical protein